MPENTENIEETPVGEENGEIAENAEDTVVAEAEVTSDGSSIWESFDVDPATGFYIDPDTGATIDPDTRTVSEGDVLPDFNAVPDGGQG